MASYEMAAATITGEAGIASISPVIADVLSDYVKDGNVTFNDARDMPATGGTDAPAFFEAIKDGDRAENTFTNSSIQTDTLAMDTDTTANVSFSADSPVTSMIVGGLGGSRVNFMTSKDVNVALQGGYGDRLTTAGGNDNIDFNGGSATINTGDGQDAVTIKGEGEADITGGSGNMVVFMQTEDTVATIDGGEGFDRLEIGSIDGRAAHNFTIENGKFVMHSEGQITMENMNVVVFQKADPDTISLADDEISILATNINDSLVGKLYQIAYGRQAIDGSDGWTDGGKTPAELGGLNFWMDQIDQLADANAANQQLIYGFLNSKEFHTNYDKMSNDEYVDSLFANLNIMNEKADVTSINGKTAADFVKFLEDNPGDPARFDVAWEIAASDSATEIMGKDGNSYVIDNFGDENPSA